MTPNPEALWSISALASGLGMDRRTITKRLKGVEPAGTERKTPVYKLADAVRAIFDAPGAAEDDKNRSRLWAAQADRAELDLERIRGELLPRDEVERVAFEHGKIERVALEQWPARVGPALAGALGVDHGRLVAALEREVRQHLEGRTAP